MTDAADPPAVAHAVPTPAATVVPMRDGPEGLEVLLLRRNARGAFGGMWVFPGGQVDPSDRDEGSGKAGFGEAGFGEAGFGEAGAGEEAEIAAARRAAVREAREEAGLELDPTRLVTLSFWQPPLGTPRRFATWFFVAPAADHPPIVVDQAEIHDHGWRRPVMAMAARDAGEIELVPPTFTTLWWLAQHGDVESALAAAAARPPERFLTRGFLGPDGALRATLWAGDAGYTDGDLDRPGPRRRLWLDAGGWRMEMSGL
jgi:8-oxo-dGTP pyrophosphatase MutT (NUDIX family)